MSWTWELTEDSEKEFARLDPSVRFQVLKGIRKVAQNPLPTSEGGYGKPFADSKNKFSKTERD